MTDFPEVVPLNEPVRADPLGLALVIALTGVLVIRPEELYPPIAGLRLYYILIVCAFLYYTSAIAQEFDRNSLARHPIWVLVLGLFAAVVLSHVTNFRFGEAFEQGQKFGKVAAYYLLLTVALTSFPALRTFLTAFVVFIVVQTLLALCQYHEYIDIEALRPIQQWEFDPDGQTSTFARLCGSGIYHDPNDLCLLLAAGILICLDRALGNGGYYRILWACLSGLFIYTLTLTHSRGGLLAVAAGATAYLTAKYGARRAIPFLLLMIPVGLAVFAGRQTRMDLSSGDDTGQGRIKIWSDGFMLIQSHPLFGIGSDQYDEECIYVAHNSFVHAYVELGLFGGGLFLAAFLLAVHAVWTTSPSSSLPQGDTDELARLRPVILGLIVSYMAGMFSLSRNYIPPTYLTLALATVYLRLAAPGGIDSFQFDRPMVVRLGAITLLGFVGLKLFIGAFVQF